MLHRANRRRFGVTLIELLVVIGILGVLVSISLPAVSYTRGLQRRTECANNLRNIALATLNYEQQMQVLPGGVAYYGHYEVPKQGVIDPDDPNNYLQSDHHKIGPWHISLLPYFGEETTFLRWTEDHYPLFFRAHDWGRNKHGFIESRVPTNGFFRCPSRSIDQGIFWRRRSRSEYVANSGCYSGDQSRPATKFDGTQLTFKTAMDTANGLFFNLYDKEHFQSRRTDVGPQSRMRDIIDGTTTTLLYTENANSKPFSYLRHRPIPPILVNAVRVDPYDSYFAKEQAYVHGFVWHHVDPALDGEGVTVPKPFRINGERDFAKPWEYPPDELNRVHWLAAFARPSSNHAGGVNMAFCDGGLKFVSETLDYRVYQALMTPHGKRSDVPFREFQLKEFP